MKKINSSEFGDTFGWTLINDYTILDEKTFKDRPHIIACVPKLIIAKLYGVRAIEHIAWAGDNCVGELSINDDGNVVSDPPDEERDKGYVRKPSIGGRGECDDKITAFTIKDGPLSQFTTFKSVSIRPLPRGRVGGKHKANSTDGIAFSGWSSKTVPPGGLMDGEPGRLWLDDARQGDGERPPSLVAQGLHRPETIRRAIRGHPRWRPKHSGC